MDAFELEYDFVHVRALENAYWHQSHAHRWHWRRGHAPPVRKPNPNLKQRPPRALFCLKLDNSCHARYNCNVVVKLMQECKFFLMHFTPILWKQFAGNDTFLNEANSYKRALTLRNSRLILSASN